MIDTETREQVGAAVSAVESAINDALVVVAGRDAGLRRALLLARARIRQAMGEGAD